MVKKRAKADKYKYIDNLEEEPDKAASQKLHEDKRRQGTTANLRDEWRTRLEIQSKELREIN